MLPGLTGPAIAIPKTDESGELRATQPGSLEFRTKGGVDGKHTQADTDKVPVSAGVYASHTYSGCWEVKMAGKILVVDDEEDVRIFLSGVLERAGYETLVAADGVEAFDIIEQERPSVVILDLQMPNQTGTQFYRRLTRHHELADIPVIVVSGIAGRHLAVREPFAMFDKPIDPDEFLAAVERALGKATA